MQLSRADFLRDFQCPSRSPTMSRKERRAGKRGFRRITSRRNVNANCKLYFDLQPAQNARNINGSLITSDLARRLDPRAPCAPSKEAPRKAKRKRERATRCNSGENSRRHLLLGRCEIRSPRKLSARLVGFYLRYHIIMILFEETTRVICQLAG